MKSIFFFKTCPIPEVFPVVLFTSTAGRWRNDISNMVLLHSKDGCPLMDVRTTVRAPPRGQHTKAVGAFSFSKTSIETDIAPSLK